jgi:hypothetical protein
MIIYDYRYLVYTCIIHYLLTMMHVMFNCRHIWLRATSYVSLGYGRIYDHVI